MGSAYAVGPGLVTLAPTPARNVLLWPDAGTDPNLPGVTVVPGTLQHATGGPSADRTLTPRVCAYLSLGATLSGVGEILAGAINHGLAASLATPYAGDDVAKAVAVYNRGYVTPDALRCGFRLTLPLEVDAATGHWIADAHLLDRCATSVGPADLALLTLPAQSLELSDGDAIRAAAETEIAGATDTAALAQAFAADLLANPFDVVFRGVEILRQLRGDVYGDPQRAAEEVPFVLTVLAALTDHHLDQLAFGTAGNALLRRSWRALTTGDQSQVTAADVTAATHRVAVALGLAPRPDGTWDEPTRWAPPKTAAEQMAPTGPAVEPRELPLTDDQRVGGRANATRLDGEPLRGRRAMVLGRDLYVGAPEAQKADAKVQGITYTYRGPSYVGVMDPIAFAARHASDLGTPSSPMLRACVDVAVQIAGNEGLLDACRAADRGLLSTGMQQWSVHVNTELTVLFERFQHRAWDHYDLFFGIAGVLPRMCSESSESAPPDDPSVVSANPDAGVVTFAGEHFPSYVTLDRLLAGGKPAVMPQPTSAADTGAVRVQVFGGTVSGHGTHRVVDLDADWCARVRLAGRCSVEYAIVQVQTAAYRFKRILDGPGGPPLRGKKYNIDGRGHELPDLFRSELGAAAILDQHINGPGYPAGDVQAAADRAAAPGSAVPVQPHLPGTDDLDPRWVARLAVDYLAQRRFSDARAKADRDDRIARMHDAGLSPQTDPPTFPAWP